MSRIDQRENASPLPQSRNTRRSMLIAFALTSAVSFSATGGEPGRPTGRARSASAPPKVTRYVAAILRRHDKNGDGQLDKDEWQQMSGEPSAIDRNQDGIITLPELQTHVLAYGRARAPVPVAQPDDAAFRGSESVEDSSVSVEGEPGPEAGDVSTGPDGEATAETRQRNTKYFVRPSRGLGKMPSWFLARDADGDGQLTLREFSAGSPGRSREFDKLDRNGDGVLTPREATGPRDGKQTPNP